MKEHNFFNLEIQHSVICERLDPKLALREASKMRHSEAASAQGLVKVAAKSRVFSEKFSFNRFSTQTATVKPAESPSRSHPGTPRCCCADSLMGGAVVVS